MSDPSSRPEKHRNQDRDILLLLVLLAAFRLLSLLLFRPGGFLGDFSDYYYYREYAALSDRDLYPYVNIWSPYPPLFPWLLVAVHRLTLLLPPWEEPQLLFNLVLGSTMVLAECGSLLLVYALAGGRSRPGALRSAGFYALLFASAYTALAHFDSLPVFLMLLALYLVLSRRWVLAGAMTGLGIMTKLLPALLVPLALRRILASCGRPSGRGRRDAGVGSAAKVGARLCAPTPPCEAGHPPQPRSIVPCGPPLSTTPTRGYATLLSLGSEGQHPLLWSALPYLAALVLALLLIAAPSLYSNPRLLLAPLDIQRIRPPWQTVWALLDGYYGFGVAPADVRDLSVLAGPAWSGRVPYGLLTLVFAALYSWAYLRGRHWREDRAAVSFLASSLALLFLFSKGWSPQYLAWLLPFLAVLWPDWRGAAYALTLTFLNYLESHGYFMVLPQERWLLVLTTTSRALILAVLAVQLAHEYTQPVGAHSRAPVTSAPVGRTASAHAPSPIQRWAAAGLGLAALALLSWRLLAAYTRTRYEAEPARPAIEHLRQEAVRGTVAFFARQQDLERFYPHLHRLLALRTLDERAPDGDLEAHLARQFAAPNPVHIWLVQPEEISLLGGSAERALSSLGYRAESTSLAGLHLSRWIPRWALQVPGEALVFSERVELLGWRLDACRTGGSPPPPSLGGTVACPYGGAGQVSLTLVWRPRQPLAHPLFAFVHLTDGDGPPLAQDDGPPAWPWPVGEAIVDGRALDASGLAAGTYRVLVGLYDPQSGERLSLPDGVDAFRLGLLEVKAR